MCSVPKRIFNMNKTAGSHRSNGGNSERRAEPDRNISHRVHVQTELDYLSRMGNAESPAVIIIEPATAADLDDIVRIEEACFSAPWTRKMLEAELVGNQFSSF